MPNNDTTVLTITAPDDPEAFFRFATHYLDVDGYEPDWRDTNTMRRFRDAPEWEQYRLDKPCLSHAFAPMPEECRRTVEGTHRVVAPNGHTWRTWAAKNWGSKWGTYDETHELGEAQIRIRFDSAWEPPMILLTSIGSLFPALAFDMRWHSEYNDKVWHAEFSGGDTFTVDAFSEVGEFSTSVEEKTPTGWVETHTEFFDEWLLKLPEPKVTVYGEHMSQTP